MTRPAARPEHWDIGLGKLQLRALFLSGTSLGFSAQDTFTNRLSEAEAFALARREVAAIRRRSFHEVFHEPRRNVLSYYGSAGIGKTALSKKLERDAHRLGAEGDEHLVSTVRFDLRDPLDREPETWILGLRAALGRVCAYTPAFDLALAVYWERSHPGYPLHDFLRNHGALSQAANELQLAENIQQTVVEALAFLGPIGGLIGAGTQGARWVVRRVRQARQEHRLLEDCPFFGQLVEADADEDALTYLASLLAWDLANVPDRHRRELLVFLDTYEELALLGDRRTEQLLQRICFLLPNVLFVVTGRNRLDWAELRPPAELDFVGPRHWPLLTPAVDQAEPRQHLLGYLSEHDCREFLRSVFASADHRMPLAIEDAIIRAGGGLPLYLDLEVAHYLELLAAGTEPEPAMFGGPLSAVVSRCMQDMTPEERRLLRSASLLKNFDAELLRDTAGAVPDAAVERFLSRPFIEHHHHGTTIWRHTTHATLRDTVRLVDHELSDGWSRREWRAAARRALTSLEERLAAAVADARHDVVAGAFDIGLDLASAYDLPAEWLIDASRVLADAGSWSQLDKPGTGEPSAGEVLRRGFRGIALRRRGRLADSIAELDACLAHDGLSTPARRYFQLHRANSLRNSGAYDVAEAAYRELVRGDDGTADAARYQLADLDLLHGRFAASLAAVASDPADPYLRTEYRRLRGHVARFSGRFEEAEAHYREALVDARDIHSLAAEGKALTNIAECSCWSDPPRARVEAAAAVEFNRDVGNRLEVSKGLVALGIAHAASGDERGEQALREAAALADDVGYVAARAFAHWAWCFRAFHRGAVADLAAERRTLAEVQGRIGTYAFLVEIADLWLAAFGESTATLPATTDWSGGVDAASRAWLATRGAT